MKLAVTLSAALLMGCSAAVTPTATASKFDRAAMDTLLSQAVSSGDVIGTSAMVFDEGQVVYQGTFGLGDRERNVPVDMDTVWRIYSMTKPVTSVVIMDLQEEGKLKLSDPVSKYIPELANMRVAKMGEDGTPSFEPQARPMTLEDLMLHRSGIGYGIFGPINPVAVAYEKAGLVTPDETLWTRQVSRFGLIKFRVLSLIITLRKMGHMPLLKMDRIALLRILRINFKAVAADLFQRWATMRNSRR